MLRAAPSSEVNKNGQDCIYIKSRKEGRIHNKCSTNASLSSFPHYAVGIHGDKCLLVSYQSELDSDPCTLGVCGGSI